MGKRGQGSRSSPKKRKNKNKKEMTSPKSRGSGRKGSTKISESLKKEFQEQKRTLTIWRSPLRVIWYFSQKSAQWGSEYTMQLLRIKWFTYGVLPVLALFTLMCKLEGKHQAIVEPIYTEVAWIGWWVGLGVLSSVGLGTGMHSGILFLFPFIAKTCFAASTCGTLNFNTYGKNEMECPPEGAVIVAVTFWGLFCKVWWPCFLWGSGTAIGEVPPYVVTRAARMAGEEAKEFQEELGLSYDGDDTDASKADVVTRMKLWMVGFLQRYGWWAVFAFASWPNAAFDMCGLAAGHFGMPFWEFFTATWAGKAVIKVGMQACLMIVLFSDDVGPHFVDVIISSIARLGSLVGQHDVEKSINGFLSAQRERFKNPDAHQPASGGIFKKLWSLVLVCFIGYFVLSIMESFAQQRLIEIQSEKIKNGNKDKTR